jgi:hypothetical protein
MKYLIFLFTILITISAFAMNGAPDIYFDGGDRGEVKFDHYAHLIDFQCFTCHHLDDASKQRDVERARPCRNCHSKDETVETMKTIAHQLCKNCHKKLKRGPIKCKGCHSK